MPLLRIDGLGVGSKGSFVDEVVPLVVVAVVDILGNVQLIPDLK